MSLKQNSNQSNLTMRKKYFNYSPSILKISKDDVNIINDIDKNMNFFKQNNYPLVTYNNIEKIIIIF